MARGRPAIEQAVCEIENNIQARKACGQYALSRPTDLPPLPGSGVYGGLPWGKEGRSDRIQCLGAGYSLAMGWKR